MEQVIEIMGLVIEIKEPVIETKGLIVEIIVLIKFSFPQYPYFSPQSDFKKARNSFSRVLFPGL